ncbi:hypothetical protein EC973_003635 [Apophysomyces ossiformis]|uniref:Uncharacterized protein n=1 Tax=Apophysomyces ossiformis TaxID=679940 RepID=A0A8H7BXT9_9FUNG|nr:hypothetical protein EC973_003635 [Apophysomyces ossiformis]
MYSGLPEDSFLASVDLAHNGSDESDIDCTLDLTATAQTEGFENETEQTPNPSMATTQSPSTEEQDAISFLTEGTLSPNTLRALGIDIEEIRAQKRIEEEIERTTKKDLMYARELQEQLDREAQSAREARNENTDASSHEIRPNPNGFTSADPLPSTHNQWLAHNNNQPMHTQQPLPVHQCTQWGPHIPNQQIVYNQFPNVAGSKQPYTVFSPFEVHDRPYKRLKQDDAHVAASSSSLPKNNGKQPAMIDLDEYDDIVDLTQENEIDSGIAGPFVPPFSSVHSMMQDPLLKGGLARSFGFNNMKAPMPTWNEKMKWKNYGYYGEEDDEDEDDEDDYDGYDEDPLSSIMGLIHQSQARYRTLFNSRTISYYAPGGSCMSSQRSVDPQQAEKELRELLENITHDIPSPEDRTGTPDGLAVALLEHQKIGLQWLLKMEQSSNKGGILADDMGLGKTVQAMALIVDRKCQDATDLSSIIPKRGRGKRPEEKIKTKATLVVCPIALMGQWQREILDKTSPKLKVCVHHGQGRATEEHTLAPYDVIITSYSMVANDLVEEEAKRGPLSRLEFHRVILDEAHIIKNKRTRMAEACCRLQADHRWCLTATPIQNKIDELYSLIKFLKIRPYCEWEEFRDEIAKPMKNGAYEQALKKVQILLKAIALRRSKKAKIDGKPILSLPERNVHFTHVDFTEDERQFYDYVDAKAQARFNKYVNAGTVMKNYSSVLVLLLRLRQACLHPSLTIQEHSSDESNEEEQKEVAEHMPATVVSRLLEGSSDFSQIECPICMDMADEAQIIAQCGHILCRECLYNYLNTNDGNNKRCPQCRCDLQRDKVVGVETFLKVHAPELYKEIEDQTKSENQEALAKVQEFISSTKIDKMLEILDETRRTTNGKEKTVVFSQFTSFLDLIERPLKNAGHKFIRYDGSLSIRKRDALLQEFYSDPSVTVLLVSTKCGSLGLNLTVANRVILMDIWWNPALENQAIDRVHRIGQTKNVEVHRIFVNDTVEDRILELQKKKQDLCDGALGEGSGQKLGRLGLQEMLYLFRGGTYQG